MATPLLNPANVGALLSLRRLRAINGSSNSGVFPYTKVQTRACFPYTKVQTRVCFSPPSISEGSNSGVFPPSISGGSKGGVATPLLRALQPLLNVLSNLRGYHSSELVLGGYLNSLDGLDSTFCDPVTG